MENSIALAQVMNNHEDISVLLQWYHARDVFLGTNHRERSFSEGVALAACCMHKSAKWLVEVVARHGIPVSLPDAREMFQAERDDDPDAVCFASLLGWRIDFELLCKAAHLGCALAQGRLAFGLFHGHFGPADYVRALFWAEHAAAQLEPGGYFVLGQCYERGAGVNANKAKSLEFYKRAAGLGDVDSCYRCVVFYRLDQSEYFFWLGKFCCGARRNSEEGVKAFLTEGVKRIRELVRDPELGRVVYQIGESLQGHVDEKRRTVFGRPESEVRLGAAVRAIGMHAIWCKKALAAVETWLLVGLRYNVCRDIRVKIARIIWASRKEALYLNELQWDAMRFFDRKLMKLILSV